MTGSAPLNPALWAGLRGASKKEYFLTGKLRPVGGELHIVDSTLKRVGILQR